MKVAAFALFLLTLIAVAGAMPNLRVALSSGAIPTQYRVVQPTMTLPIKSLPAIRFHGFSLKKPKTDGPS